jgi:carbon storage regulator
VEFGNSFPNQGQSFNRAAANSVSLGKMGDTRRVVLSGDRDFRRISGIGALFALDLGNATKRLAEVNMLVLSRKADEAIVLDGAVRITVLGVKGDRVRLGIEAPRDVMVDRAEVHERRTQFVEMPAYASCGASVDASEFMDEAELTRF